MTALPRTFIVAASVCLLAAVPDPGYAQASEPSVTIGDARTATPLAAAVDFETPQPVRSYGPDFAKADRWASGQSRSRGMSATAKGALIGGGAAAIATFVAASGYSETDGVCGACFAQWSAFTVPVGAGIGAAIGWSIDRSRRSVAAVPVFSRKAAGVVVTARF